MYAAKTPLTGEQLNVALTVQPGNIAWNDAKLPRSPKQVVARCGGGLLEVDEEDDCVRFIHSSVELHLENLRVGMNDRRLARSWSADAEAFMGSVCVTYLSYPEFDRRMVLSRSLNTRPISEALKKQAYMPNPKLARVVRHLKGDKHRTVPTEQLNILPILLAARKTSEDTMSCFLPYASKYWVQHTAHLGEEDGAKIDILWRELVKGTPPHVSIPWSQPSYPSDEKSMLRYATHHSHAYIYRYVLKSSTVSEAGLFEVVAHLVRAEMGSGEDQKVWLTEMIDRCFVAGPSFTRAAYLFALVLGEIVESKLYVTTASTTTLLLEPQARRERFEINRYAVGMSNHFGDIMIESAEDRLWAIVEEACTFTCKPTHQPNDPRDDTLRLEGMHKALAAALRLLATRLRLQECSVKESSKSDMDAFWRTFDAFSKGGDEHAFRTFWDYRLLVVNWGGEAPDLDSLAVQAAFKHKNFKRITTIATHWDVNLSIVEHILEQAKQQAESMIHPKLLLGRLMESTSYVKDQELAYHTDLASAGTYMMNKQYDEALAAIQRYITLSDHGTTDNSPAVSSCVVQHQMALRWVIIHRCKYVFRRLPFLREAIMDWPTVLTFAIMTFANTEPSDDNKRGANERGIFFGLLEFMKRIEPYHLRARSLADCSDNDPGWTALHAAALWRPFAVEALLNIWPDMVNVRTQHGLTPLVVALCGPLGAEEAYATVEALLNAGADTGALWGYPDISPLDISMACRPYMVSQLLVKFGARRSVHLEGIEDLTHNALLNLIALLESRLCYQDDLTMWGDRSKKVTSVEEWYTIGSPTLVLGSPVTQFNIYEVPGCGTLHLEGQKCDCSELYKDVYELDGCYEFHSAGSACNCADCYDGEDTPPQYARLWTRLDLNIQ